MTSGPFLWLRPLAMPAPAASVEPSLSDSLIFTLIPELCTDTAHLVMLSLQARSARRQLCACLFSLLIPTTLQSHCALMVSCNRLNQLPHSTHFK